MRPNQRKPKAPRRNTKGDARAVVAHAHVETNAGKLAMLDALLVTYGGYVQSCIETMVSLRITSVDVKDAEAMHGTFGPSTMTSQLQKCARQQAVGIMQSWANGLYGRTLSDYITAHKAEYTDDELRQLRTIGKYMIREPSGGKNPIEQRLVDLYWSWVWDADVSGKRPALGNSGMMLGEMCCEYGTAEEASGLGGWWIAVSTLTPYKRVCIPLAPHPKLDGKTKLAKTVLVRKRHDGRWTVQFTEYVAPIAEPSPDAPRVGVDVGKRELLVTSDDRHYGTAFSPAFDRLWNEIKETRRNRHRQGLPKNSKRLASMERRLSGMVKTNVGRAVNEVIRDYPGHVFVLEDLHLCGVRGSKRFAYTEAVRSFKRKVPTISCNPAYTSQECPSCHYVSRLNRRGGQFRCIGCGRISHADCVGGIGLAGRSSDKQITLDTSVDEVRAILRTRYLAARSGIPLRYDGSSAGGRVSRSATVAPDAHSRDRPKGPRGKASNSPVVKSP